MTNSILTKKRHFPHGVAFVCLQKDFVFDFFNKILHTSTVSESNINFSVKVLVYV